MTHAHTPHPTTFHTHHPIAFPLVIAKNQQPHIAVLHVASRPTPEVGSGCGGGMGVPQFVTRVTRERAGGGLVEHIRSANMCGELL
jgi:hypothetical protein